MNNLYFLTRSLLKSVFIVLVINKIVHVDVISIYSTIKNIYCMTFLLIFNDDKGMNNTMKETG